MPIEILSYETTPLGTLCLRRRELLSKPGTIVTEVSLNHEFLMSSYLTESEQQLALHGLNRVQGDELEVLVGGLGLGYTAAAVLSSERVTNAEVVEFLPQVIDWTEDELIPLARQLKEDKRLSITSGDIYARLSEAATKTFDLIVIDVDHSPQDILGSQSDGFYSTTGLSSASSHLKEGGILGIWSYAPDSPLLTNLKKVFADVQVEQVTVWNELINEQQTDWLYFARR